MNEHAILVLSIALGSLPAFPGGTPPWPAAAVWAKIGTASVPPLAACRAAQTVSFTRPVPANQDQDSALIAAVDQAADPFPSFLAVPDEFQNALLDDSVGWRNATLRGGVPPGP